MAGVFAPPRRSSPADERIAQLESENAQLKQQLTPPDGVAATYATVISATESEITIAKANEIVSIPVNNRTGQYRRGNVLKVDVQDGRILAVVSAFGIGPVVTVSRVSKDLPDWVEVSGQGGTIRVLRDLDTTPLEIDDQVILDSTGSVVTTRLPRPVQPVRQKETMITWADIGGQQEAKTVLRDIIESPTLYPELYKVYKRKAAKGVLLYGPPGCGKTMLGKAAASAIQGDGETESGFIYVKATEILNQFVGVSEANVRAIFLKAKAHKEKHGTPAVIFIDEADAILGVRGERASIGMEGTVVPAFLTEMDGMDESSAVVILATNRPDTLDPAVIRDGRIDRKVLVSRPGPREVMHLTRFYLGKVPLHDGLVMDEAEVLVGKAMYHDDGTPTGFGKVASGALVQGIVERATSFAFARDAKECATTPTGVALHDLTMGLQAAEYEFISAQQNHLHL